MILNLIIVGVTVVLSIMAFSSQQMMSKWLLMPYEIKREKEYYRFLTSGFLHANWIHLLINMFILFQFGGIVEREYQNLFGAKGILYYGILYVFAILVASIPSYIKHRDNPSYASLGASGAVSAVVFAFILFYPVEMLYIWAIIPMPGIVLGVLYLVYSAYMAKKESDNVNHDAHFYGAVFGIVFTIILKPQVAVHFVNQIMNVF